MSVKDWRSLSILNRYSVLKSPLIKLNYSIELNHAKNVLQYDDIIVDVKQHSFEIVSAT